MAEYLSISVFIHQQWSVETPWIELIETEFWEIQNNNI